MQNLLLQKAQRLLMLPGIGEPNAELIVSSDGFFFQPVLHTK